MPLELSNIVLLNTSFKIFTKVGTKRVTGIAQKVVRQSQSTSIPSRNILEGVVILHGTIHELHRKKMDAVLFKIDFKRCMIKSSGHFFSSRFSPLWSNRVVRFVKGEV